jgi:transcriptional regulator with XRE-family HTH domain
LKRATAGCILSAMLIGQRLREMRESKSLTQGDIEQRTGLFRSYTSRVENGHSVPSVATLQRYARALEIPVYKFFYDGKQPPRNPKLSAAKAEIEWGARGNHRRELRLFAKLLSHLNDRNRRLLMEMATRMASRSGHKQ